jgi:FkbM family methyltransferase
MMRVLPLARPTSSVTTPVAAFSFHAGKPMWQDKARRFVAGIASRLPAFRGKGRVVLLLDRLLTNPKDPCSYLLVGTINGDSRMRLDLRTFNQKFAFYYGKMERDYLAAAKRFYRPGLFLDVGGCLGLWAIPMGLQAKKQGGRVVSFEPIPANQQRFQENIQLNGVADVVELLPLALGSEAGMLFFHACLADGADNAMVVADGEIKAAVVPLDQLAAEKGWQDITFIKIDVEGFDAHVIAGGQETIRRWRPVLFAEFNRERTPFYGLSNEASWNFLVGELGYHCFRMARGQLIRLDALEEWDDLFFLPPEMGKTIG